MHHGEKGGKKGGREGSKRGNRRGSKRGRRRGGCGEENAGWRRRGRERKVEKEKKGKVWEGSSTYDSTIEHVYMNVDA